MKYALEARDIARNIEKCLNGGPVDLAAMRVQADRLAQHAHLVRSVEGILASEGDAYRGSVLAGVAEIMSALITTHRVFPMAWSVVAEAIRVQAAVLDEWEASLPASWHQPSPAEDE